MTGNKEISSNTLINNRYLIQNILGQGGLGRTYLAFDTHRFNELCVLKEFSPFGSVTHDVEKSRNLFKREAKILHHLTHPQIPKFLACFETQGRLFLVQEYVNGHTYSALLEQRQQQKRAFQESEVIKWLSDLLPILDYIHQLGIIHRDISPDNIMQPEGKSEPVLIDFGVGKLGEVSSSQSTQNGFTRPSYVGKISFVGKVGYAPREQITMGRCSPSSDLYALGVTALVLLTGKEPTALIDKLSLEWQWQKYARVSSAFSQILFRMTEEKPLRRYQSAREVLQDLKQLSPDEFRGSKTNFASPKRVPSSSQPKASPKQPNFDETVITAPSTPNYRPPKVDETMIVTGVNSSPQPTPKNDSTRNPRNLNSPPIDQTMIVTGVNSSAQPTPSNNSVRNPRNLNSPPIDQTMIVTGVNSSPHKSKSLTPGFIRRCEQELAPYLGVIASIVVEEVIKNQNPQSPEELIDALAEQISDSKQAREFRRRF